MIDCMDIFPIECLVISGISKTYALIIQASRNGGITWSNLHKVYSSDLHDTSNLIHVELSQYARYEDVSFRIWQSHADTSIFVTLLATESNLHTKYSLFLPASPTFEEGQDVWSVDNLLIGGRKTSCNIYIVEDNFTSTTTTWLHNTHTDRNYFCGSSDQSIIVGPTLGEHSITTKDLCVSENYVIQFNVSI